MKRLLSFVLSAALIVSGTYAANSMHIFADEASSGVGSSATPQTELDPASSPQITKEPGAVPDDTPQVSGQPTVKPDDAPQVSGQPTAKPDDAPQVSEQPTTVPGNTPQVSEQPTTVPSNTPQATVEPSATPQVTEVTAPIAPQVTQIKGGLSASSYIGQNKKMRADIIFTMRQARQEHIQEQKQLRIPVLANMLKNL